MQPAHRTIITRTFCMFRLVRPCAALAAACLLLGGCAAGTAVKPAPRPAVAVAVAPPVAQVAAPVDLLPPPVMPAPFPTPVVELAGSAGDLGAAHGRHFGPLIRDLQARYLGAYFRSNTARLLAMLTATAFERQILPEHLAEVKSLAAAAGVDYRQMLLAQCFLDLSPMTACSTVTLPPEACADGVGRFGRNLDFPGFDIAERQSVVFVCRPDDGRYAFAAVSWPSLVGVLSGMNEHGLAVANMEVVRRMRLPVAMPYTLLYRSILERCKTVDEAVALLRRTPRQTANNLMLMDAGGNRAVAEITPEKVTVRRGLSAAALVSTNHQRGADDGDTPGRCDRYDCLHDLSTTQFGRIDLAGVQAMLSRSAQQFTLQSMVFEPSTRVVYLSTGPDAARGTFHRLDLKPYFAGAVPPVGDALP